jgi:protein-tyrosine phosphatase
VLRDLLAEFAHWVRGHWQRLLHPFRRRRLLRQLRRHRMPRGVLFVCHGNICRSPYAAAAFRAQLGPEAAQVINVASAGFIGPIRPAPRFAREEAASRGLDLTNHRSMTLSPVVLGSVDIVAVMEPDQAAGVTRLFPTTASIIVLSDLDPLPNGGRTILDPVDQSRAVFAQSYDRIDRCVAQLAQAVMG